MVGPGIRSRCTASGFAGQRSSPMAKRAMAAVYACRKQVAGLDDEESWRDFLEETTGKRSLRQMSGGELGRVIGGLHERGAVKKAGGKKGWRAGQDRRSEEHTSER